MLSKIRVGRVRTHEPPVLWHYHRGLVGVFQRRVKAVIVVHRRASFEAELLIVIHGLIAPFSRPRSDRRWIWSSHLILVDLRRCLIKGDTLSMTMKTFALRQLLLLIIFILPNAGDWIESVVSKL
jgi:hypothetical protein